MITNDNNIFMLLSYLQVRSKQCHLLVVPVIALNCSLMNQGVVLSKVDLRHDKGFITRIFPQFFYVVSLLHGAIPVRQEA